MRIHRHSEGRELQLAPYLLDASVLAALVVILTLSWKGLPQAPALAPGVAAEKALARHFQLPASTGESQPAMPNHLAEVNPHVAGRVAPPALATPGGG